MNAATIYRGYDQQTLDLQYNNQAAVPLFRDHIQRYRTLTDEAKLKLKCIENLAYGIAPEETLDLYRALQDSAPVLIFVHGGAWQHLGKNDSGFAANAFVPKAQFTWRAGEAHVKRFDLPTAQRFSVWFCDTCGTRVPHQVRGREDMLIPAGLLDQPPADMSRPQNSIFWGSRAPWYVVPVDHPCLEQMT